MRRLVNGREVGVSVGGAYKEVAIEDHGLGCGATEEVERGRHSWWWWGWVVV